MWRFPNSLTNTLCTINCSHARYKPAKTNFSFHNIEMAGEIFGFKMHWERIRYNQPINYYHRSTTYGQQSCTG